MTRTAETKARDAKIAELKRLITTHTYETLEMLEEAVDSFLWSEYDQGQADEPGSLTDSIRPLPR